MNKKFLLKILVIVLAGLIWLFQAFLKHHQIMQEIPVTLYNIPEKFVLLQNNDVTIPVTFYGRGVDYLFLKMSRPFILINAGNFSYGENKLNIVETNLVFPERAKLEIRNISSDEGQFIFLDRQKLKQLPLELRFSTAADEEFFLENKILNRDQRIQVTGPESVLKAIFSIKTKPISRKQVRDGKISVELEKPEVQIQIMKESILLDVAQTKIINRTISLIPIEYPLNKNITIIPQKVSVLITGPKEIVDKMNQNSIRAYFNSKDLDKLPLNKSRSIAVEFSFPAGIKLIEYTPERIQILRNE